MVFDIMSLASSEDKRVLVKTVETLDEAIAFCFERNNKIFIESDELYYFFNSRKEDNDGK